MTALPLTTFIFHRNKKQFVIGDFGTGYVAVREIFKKKINKKTCDLERCHIAMHWLKSWLWEVLGLSSNWK